MSFASRETSRQLGAPIALFLFTYGPNAGDIYAYTSSEDPVTYGGVEYTPVPINHDTFTASGSLDKAAMELKLSKFLDLNNLFTYFPPSQVVSLKIYMGHVGEPEFKPMWTGRLIAHRIEGDNAVYTCEPISTALRRPGLRRNYQRGCPHVLYGDQCRVARNAFAISKVVQTVNSPQITLPDGWNGSRATSHYVHGQVWWTNPQGRTEYRSVIRILNPTTLLLSGDCGTLSQGMTVNLAPGCNHQMDDCTNVFNNINNFGGQPWIPLKNPLGIINNFT